MQALRGTSKTRSVMSVRRQCMLIVALAYPDFSYPDLGRLFGRDHTTIISALRGTQAWVHRKQVKRRVVEQGVRYRVG